MSNIITSTTTILNPQFNQVVHDTLLNLLQLAALGLSAGVAYGTKLWINSMNSGWKQTLATRLVKFAEQRLIGSPEKLAYVSQKLAEHFPRLSQEEINHLIEEAVNNLPGSTTTTTTVTPTVVATVTETPSTTPTK